MNEQIKNYLEWLMNRAGMPWPLCRYTTTYLQHVTTNDWIANAYVHEYVQPLFVGTVELCHGLLSTPWGPYRVYVELYAIGEAGAFKVSMKDALTHSGILWDYATSTPISEVLMNKQTRFYIDNESSFIDSAMKHYKRTW